jgi:putative DNA primase/helicase
LANRFVVLRLEESHLGKEDRNLLHRLTAELPGILLWAIEGWRRLHARGHFVQPATSSGAMDEMLALSSPVKAFVAEWCGVSSAAEVTVDDLYKAWTLWCRLQGTTKPSERNVFGRNLSAAFPSVHRGHKGSGSDRVPVYKGIRLSLVGQQSLSVERAKEEERERRRDVAV